MIDELTLRERFPEIPWDQPVEVFVSGDPLPTKYPSYWCCRYCIALEGLSARQLIRGNVPFGFDERAHCLDHIEERHHE